MNFPKAHRGLSNETHLHGLHHWVAHVMPVVTHSIHCHVHNHLPSYWLPKCVPVVMATEILNMDTHNNILVALVVASLCQKTILL